MAKGKSISVPSRPGGYESVSVRPIDNGFIVCKSGDKGYSETYSATKPRIEVPAQPAKAPASKAAPRSSSALGMAMSHAKGK